VLLSKPANAEAGSHLIRTPKLSSKKAELSQAKREERLAQYQQIVVFRKQGLSQAAIAERVGVARTTVSRWRERSSTLRGEKFEQCWCSTSTDKAGHVTLVIS